jgi:hypothetical protein
MFERTFLLKGGLKHMMFLYRFRFGVAVVGRLSGEYSILPFVITFTKFYVEAVELLHIILWPRSQRLVSLMTETIFFG